MKTVSVAIHLVLFSHQRLIAKTRYFVVSLCRETGG